MNYFPVDRKLPCIYEGEPKSVKGFNIFHVTEDRYTDSSYFATVPVLATVFLNDKIHVFQVSSNYHQSHEIYDKTECRLMNDSPLGLSCAFVFHNELYIAGRASGNYSAIWKYNESDDTWTMVITFPCYVIGSGVAISHDQVYFFGGKHTSDPNYYKSNYRWDGTTVTQLNDLPYSATSGVGLYCEAVTDSVGAIHIFGVDDGTGGNFKQHYIYTSDGSFTKTDSPVLYTMSTMAFTWADGAIHAFGNSGADKYKNNHYVWTLDNQQWVKAEDVPYISVNNVSATSHDDIIEVVTKGGHCKKILGQWYNQSPSPYVIPIFN